MDMQETAEDRAFRAEVAGFIADKLPADIRTRVRDGYDAGRDDTRRWHEILAARGWLVPSWPAEWGGAGWNVMQRHIFEEECALGYCPPVHGITIGMLGPVLIRYGTEAQKQRYLPAILNVREWWCQGYSEPGAGSDLASLKTEARRDGDAYIVNGSKIWTSTGEWATHMFCLVRTDKSAKPQEGISFLLIDMKTAGISIRPIHAINGHRLFNQVFLDNVVVPVENLVHKENDGWSVAKSLLEHERLNLSRVGESKKRLHRLKEIARVEREGGRTLIEQDWFRRKLAALETRLRALDATVLRFIARTQSGAALDPSVSMLKLRGSQLVQDILQATVDALGYYGLPFDLSTALSDSDPLGGLADDDLDVLPDYAAGASVSRFRSRAFTIAGGSSEVQRNVMAKQVLKL
ncbi:MAG: acyl-CoA dehydrogenase family protein [Hyphomicrobiales bacterium]|nr:acyl-CoA dehydrogenase family protein [Hyphomicrobiales bacterium]